MSPLFQVLLLLASLFEVTISAGIRRDVTICQQIEFQLPGRVSYPGNTGYEETLSSYYSGQERDLQPACVFRPTATHDVSYFVKTITTSGGGKPSSQFAIRGGGHTLFRGAANINGGITVDMRSMNSLTLNKDQTVASVGGGGIWSDLYPQLVPHNLTVVGGRFPGIALGGFLTGGGINFLSRRVGFGCDNVNGYEVVLANGDIVYATASSHRDLWLALKGGSNNFGIITRFDLATYQQGDMWGGVILFGYTPSVLDTHANFFSSFMDAKNFDDAANMATFLTYQNGSFGVADSLFYVEPVADPPVYQPLVSQPSSLSNNLKIDNVANIVAGFAEAIPPSLARGTEIAYTFQNADAATYLQLMKTWEEGIKSLNGTQGLLSQFLIQPQPVTNGTNSLGLTPGERDSVFGLVTVGYDNSADDSIVQSAVQAIVNKHIQILRKKNLYNPFQYLNYADISQDPFTSYGKQNKARLQAASLKYDPSGVFQKRVPGGFKLFR
ncbi:oxidoreductase FAD-binding protein [Nemania sp. FL0916]|nr:oxidoreductase FAD-binding protein [Nemania sp. FL0916]